MKTLGMVLRVGLTALLIIAAIAFGITFAPAVARFARGQNPAATAARAQPDWGGGQLTNQSGPADRVIDSIKTAFEADHARASAWSSRTAGFAVGRKAGTDCALALVMPSPGDADRPVLIDLPSTDHLRKELFPGAVDATAPADDVPLYPGSSCRLQVGHGTACFTGFYLTPDAPDKVRTFYRNALGRNGWQHIAGGGNLETFSKPDEDRIIVLQLRAHDSTSTRIGLVAMASASPDRNERN